jgi:hypothetical protein
MLPAITTRPRLAALLLIVLCGGMCVATWTIVQRRRASRPSRHRYRYSAFGAFHDAFCRPDSTRIIPNALQHDAYGNPYLWECNRRGFTIVSAGPDGVYETADDERSDR